MSDRNKSSDYQRLSQGTEPELTLTWTNLNLLINKKIRTGLCKHRVEPAQVIDGVSGYAKAGECLAIIGGSGAGKSTLLNLISDRFVVEKNMEFEGEVHMGVEPIDYEKYKKKIGFVMQADYFLENLTVREYFKFAVDLKKPNLTEEAKAAEVQELLKILRMENAADTLIGGHLTKGISGGEKKRLNIGFELLSNPKILFLDEPTSGLDSYTSFVIVKLLRRLAREKNLIVIYTIHQPSTDIFKLFDKLCIIHEGKNVYFGPARGSLEYFETAGFECPRNHNPMDYFIDVVKKADEPALEKLYEHFDKELESDIQAFGAEQQAGTLVDDTIMPSFLIQFFVLMKRAFLNFFRGKFALGVRIVQLFFFSILAMIIFRRFSKDHSDPKSALNRQGAIFLLLVNCFITNMQNILLTFPAERVAFTKEFNSGLYGVVPYYLSKVIIELPFIMIVPWIQISIIYYVLGFKSGFDHFLSLGACMMVLSMLGNVWGIFVGTISPKPKLALQLAPMIFIPFVLTSGFTTNTKNIGWYLKWLEYLSPFRYSFEWAVYNEFEDTDFMPNPIDSLNLTQGISQCASIMIINFVVMQFVCVLMLRLNTGTIKN